MFSHINFLCVFCLMYLLNNAALYKMRHRTPEPINPAHYNESVLCTFQSNSHVCENHTLHHSFFYDIQLQDCVMTHYGGCKYAFNNFHKHHDCKEKCAGIIPKQKNTTLPPNIFCRFQPDFGDCSHYFPLFYYNIVTGNCVGFAYSGCGGNHNRFETVQLCRRICDIPHEPEPVK